MPTDQARHWCIFTSAGNNNAIRLWLEGHTPQRWDLVVAYYGDSPHIFSGISKLCSHAFYARGSKFQNLKKLVAKNPQAFEQYSHVWVCDDDILMSGAQIDEAFDLTESLGFWVAQPADSREGRISHWITCSTGTRWDYRIVNFIEVRMPIFRRDKLTEFLNVYDGSLTGWGIDYWFANLFKANESKRFAIIDKVRVGNPHHKQRGGSAIDQLQVAPLREAAWHKVQAERGLVEYTPQVFAYCKLAPKRDPLGEFGKMQATRKRRQRSIVWLLELGFIVRALFETLHRSGWREATWLLRCSLTTIRQKRAVTHL